MSYKTLVTVVRHPDHDSAHLEAAIALAKAEDAHLHVVALGIERVPPEAFYGGTASIAVQGTLTNAIEDADAAEKAVAERLNRSDATADVQRVVAQIGAISQVVARLASLSDLVILPQPYGENRHAEDVAILEAALFSTRTPVLVLPAGVQDAPAARKIVIAWNQSAEALAATRAALPMLKAADMVDILVIDPPKHSSGLADPGAQLAEMLARHDVVVDVSVVAQTMPAVSDVIDRHVSDQGADMVVMGAYGHSRLMEAILGGATRNMLEKSRVPVLMAH